VKDWKKKLKIDFGRFFYDSYILRSDKYDPAFTDLENFISDLLSTQKESFIKIIESKKGDEDAYPIWNDTLDDIKKEVEDL